MSVDFDTPNDVIKTVSAVQVNGNNVFIQNLDKTTASYGLNFTNPTDSETWRLESVVTGSTATDRYFRLIQNANAASSIKVYQDTTCIGDITRASGIAAQLKVGGKAYIRDGVITNSIETESEQVLTISAPAGVHIKDGTLIVDKGINSLSNIDTTVQDKTLTLSVVEQSK